MACYPCLAEAKAPKQAIEHAVVLVAYALKQVLVTENPVPSLAVAHVICPQLEFAVVKTLLVSWQALVMKIWQP